MTHYNPSSNNGSAAHIIGMWALLSDAERISARSWYVHAHLDACTIARSYDLELPIVSQVISAISPMRSWENNMVDAETLITAWRDDPRDYKRCRIPLPSGWRCVRKAYAILNRLVEIATSAPKTWNFYHNILDPYSPNYVTVDSHAARIWLADRQPGTMRITARQYRLCKADYIAAANALGELPNVVQAGTWTKRRQLLLEDGQLGPSA